MVWRDAWVAPRLCGLAAGQGLALASVNRKLSTVKVYAGFAAQAGIIGGADLTLIKRVGGYAAKEFNRVDEKREAAASRLGRAQKKRTPRRSPRSR